jgi:anaphase-promoting complex subunit 1
MKQLQSGQKPEATDASPNRSIGVMHELLRTKALNALPLESENHSLDERPSMQFAKDILLHQIDGNIALLRGSQCMCTVSLPSPYRELPLPSRCNLQLKRQAGQRFSVAVPNLNLKPQRCVLRAQPASRPVRDVTQLLGKSLGMDEMHAFEQFRFEQCKSVVSQGLDGELEALGEAIDGFVGRHPPSSDKFPGTASKYRDETEWDDWDTLLTSELHRRSYSYQALMEVEIGVDDTKLKHGDCIDNTWNLRIEKQQRAKAVLAALHAYFEDCKLDLSRWWLLGRIGRLAVPLAASLGAEDYIEHYLRSGIEMESSMLSSLPKVMSPAEEPADIHKALEARLHQNQIEHAPTLALELQESQVDCLRRSRILLQCFEALGRANEHLQQRAKAVLDALTRGGMLLRELDTFPPGLFAPIQGALALLASNPPPHLPLHSYRLLRRWDLIDHPICSQLPHERPLFAREQERRRNERAHDMRRQHKFRRQGSPVATAKGDGMEHMLASVGRLRFNDMRLLEVKRLLTSSQVFTIRPGVSVDGQSTDETQLQQQQLWLNALRVTALPVGRGAFTAFTYRPSLTEPVDVPQLTLQGRLPEQNNANVNLDFNHAGAGNNFSVWPSFHNGVASGLRVAAAKEHLERTSVVFNKPQEPSHVHAGTLLALGLTGKLAALAPPDVYGYLKQEHDATTAALLVGLCATKRATQDQSVSKVCFLHLPAKHPPSYPDLEVPSIVQSAALFAVGLLYQGSSHRLMCEILLSEVTARPSSQPPPDAGSDHEEHMLSAGLALGLVTLGFGRQTAGLEDLGLEETLTTYIHGGQEPKNAPSAGLFSPSTENQVHRSISSNCRRWADAGHLGGQNGLVIESTMINTDVASSGATLALGLMFLKTNEGGVASRIKIPDTHYDLARVRPDFAMLRSLARGLVMWDSIQPSNEWLQSTVPSLIRGYLFQNDSRASSSIGDADVEAMVQADAYIRAGSCLAIGFRFAGTAHRRAATTLREAAENFLHVKHRGTMRIDKSALETCADACALALALVMAGTGDLDTLRLLRRMHNRLEQIGRGGLTYGQHMAIGMAIGFLFLGGGAYSFRNDRSAVAALLPAVFPKFPHKTKDHKQHLQILRHTYVLAIEHRQLTIVDATTGSELPSNVEVEVTPCDANANEVGTHVLQTPCLLPPKDGIVRLKAEGAMHLSLTLEGDRLTEALSAGRILVKKVELPSPRPRISPADRRGDSSNVVLHKSSDESLNAADDDAADLGRAEAPSVGSSCLGSGLDELHDLVSQCNGGQWAEGIFAALQSCASSGKPELAQLHLNLLTASDDCLALLDTPSRGMRTCQAIMQALQLRMVTLARKVPGVSELCEHAQLQPWLVEAPALRLEERVEQVVPSAELRSFVYANGRCVGESAQRAASLLAFQMAPPFTKIRAALEEVHGDTSTSAFADGNREQSISALAKALMLRSPSCSADQAVAIANALHDEQS